MQPLSVKGDPQHLCHQRHIRRREREDRGLCSILFMLFRHVHARQKPHGEQTELYEREVLPSALLCITVAEGEKFIHNYQVSPFAISVFLTIVKKSAIENYLPTHIVAMGPAIAASIAIIAIIIIATLNRLLRLNSSFASLFASTCASNNSFNFE